MEIEEADAAGQSDYNGQIIYFCSTACKEKFDANPEEFTAEWGIGNSKMKAFAKKLWR